LQAAIINLNVVDTNETHLIDRTLLEPKQLAIDIGDVTAQDGGSTSTEEDSTSEEDEETIRELLKDGLAIDIGDVTVQDGSSTSEEEDSTSEEDDESIRELLTNVLARNVQPVSFDIPTNFTGRTFLNINTMHMNMLLPRDTDDSHVNFFFITFTRIKKWFKTNFLIDMTCSKAM